VSTFREADAILGFALSKLCFEGPADELDRTDVAQAAIYVTSVACWRSLQQTGGYDSVTATAGLSLGEFTALHLAGAFDFTSGLKLVRLRGQAMQEAAEASAGGMVALVGAYTAQAQAVCQEVLNDPENQGDEVLVAANFNCPGQIVLSGSEAACQRAYIVARKVGLRAQMLDVVGAFHSSLMQPAADRLAQALDETDWSLPRIPVASNVTAQLHENDIGTIKRKLVEQLTSPVRWSDSMQWLIANMANCQFVELAPGKVLSGLMRRIDRQYKVLSHTEPQA